MIDVLVGDNSFEKTAALETIISKFPGEPERVDGSQLRPQDLIDLLMGQTLFTESRLVVVRDLQSNQEVWAQLADWLEKASDQVHLVIIETKIDKRSKTYRQLSKSTTIQEFNSWTERDSAKAEQWLIEQARREGVELSRKLAQLIVSRVGVNQWFLSSALEKLILNGPIDAAAVAEVVEASPAASVFSLFETALRGDLASLSQLVRDLAITEEPHLVLGLLSGQAFQLVAAATAGPDDNPSGDFSIHPYALTKLRPHARRLGRRGAAEVLRAVAQADERLKTTATPPWLIIEKTLIAIALQQK